MPDNAAKTILIIDDEAAIRDSFSDFLEDLGYRTITAENGEKGVQIFNTEQVDLLLVDLRMPKMGGLEVLKEISCSNPDFPMIVISGTGIINDAVAALRSGAWDYLLKPVKNFSILEHAVKNSLEKAQLRREIEQYQKNLETKVINRTNDLQKKTERLEKEIKLRKQSELQLNELIKEKEILLREVHHRVKNNMSIIISLINLKASCLENKQAKEILLGSENRIRAMALVHEKLYNYEDLQRIDLDEYIRELAEKIIYSYGLSKEIDLQFNIDEITLELPLLIPLGLLVNEIITNAVKHAFIQTAEPRISIACSKELDSLRIKIADNGSGIDKKTQDQKRNGGSIGLEIIELLIKQIDADLRIDTKSGTCYTITISI